jgi:hypothetical protein
MRTPGHCDKSPLKEITLRTKEKKLLQGRRDANQQGANLSVRSGGAWQLADCARRVLKTALVYSVNEI